MPLPTQPDGTPPPPVEVDGRRYTVTRLRRGRGRLALACEPPVGAPLPDYATRRRILREIDPGSSGVMVVFRDAARSAEVWCWRADAAYQERAWWPGGEAPVPDAPRRGPLPGEPGERVALALLREARRRMGTLRAAEVSSAEAGQLLRNLIQHTGGPETVRAVWRSARGLRVLDPACGSGDWLVGVMGELEAVYLACLEQMRVWVDEVRLLRRGRRPEYLRDFKALLALAADPRAYPGAAALARESIVLLNLYGTDADAHAVARCRRRVRAGAPKLPAAACNLRVGELRHGFRSRSEIARALAGAPDASDALRRITTEAELIGRADRLVRAARLERGLGDESFAAGLAALASRHAALARELDRLAFRTRGGGHRPLHLFCEWPALTRPGAFHLIREGGA